jgi:hypothetical protein
MDSRFVSYNLLVTYLGEFDKDSFREALIKTLGDGPKFIPRIMDDIQIISYEPYQMIKIWLLYEVKKGIFSEEEQLNYTKELREKITQDIRQELKKQKLVFNFATD